MKNIILTDNETGHSYKETLLISESHFKVLKKLQYTGGFLRFNISVYDEKKGICKTDKERLFSFLDNVFANTDLVHGYFH